MNEKNYTQSIADVEEGIGSALTTFLSEDGSPLSRPEQNGELQALRQWLQEVKESRLMTEREKLEQELDEAVAKEDYERAAEVRDALKCLVE